MFTKALYYPYIHIPDNLWLRKTILYWDKINPIVPFELESQIPPGHVSRELQEFGMLEFIHPEAILEYSEGDILSKSFMEIINNKDFLSKLGPPQRREYSYRIHSHKFTYALLGQLQNAELFKHDQGEWLLFEKNTGMLYMGFLASSLAKQLSLEPITDDGEHLVGFLSSQLVPSVQTRLFISLVLDELMPAPKEAVPIRRIIEFKKKNEQDLLRFRGLIRETVSKLKATEDKNQLVQELYAVRDTIKEHILSLESQLKRSRIETILDSLEVASTSLPDINVKLGKDFSVEVKNVLAPLAGIAKITGKVFNGILKKNSILESNPYVYVYKAKKAFG